MICFGDSTSDPGSTPGISTTHHMQRLHTLHVVLSFVLITTNLGFHNGPMPIVLRTATEADALHIAVLLRHTMLHDMPYLPNVHEPAEDFEYIKTGVLRDSNVVVADDAGTVVGFCAFKEGSLDHLYIHPDYQRQGLGAQLLERAKQGNDLLRLWVFQKNHGARSFYEQHGFTLEHTTDGSSNEQREPDACYFWRKNI